MVRPCDSEKSLEVFCKVSVLGSILSNIPTNELKKWLSSPVTKFPDDVIVFKVIRMRTDYEGWQKDFTRQHVKAIKWQVKYKKEDEFKAVYDR